MLLAGIDVGGTFTDLVLFEAETGRIAVTKVPTTANQADGVLHALSRLEVLPGQLALMAHGTTVATNTIVQRRGAKVALLATKGFRDVLEVGQTRRRVPNTMFDPTFRRPEPLAPRPLCLEVTERMRHSGAVHAAVEPGEIEELAAKLRAAQVESVAICFLHAYANDAHERQVGDVLARCLPQVFITRSAEVVPEHREYERCSTTVLNAYVSPVLARYLERLSDTLVAEDFSGPLYTMSSSGGTMTVEQASKLGVKTILSGPVGGVQATIFQASAARIPNVISYDMGGTSTDVALIHELTPALSTDNLVESYPVRTPQVDINSVGAGGGSIAWLDEANALNVGPLSAGAMPGPACYDRGGAEPTVTDANLLLGRLSADRPLAGRVQLRPQLAEAALTRLAHRMGDIPVFHLADGIVKLAVARMATATRAISVQRGYDPRDFTLVAFGGAGPMHACALASELNIPRVLVPPSPGNFSALGLLTSDVKHDYVRTRLALQRDLAPGEIERLFREIEERARAELASEGFTGQRVRLQRSLDLRYHGQAWEVSLPVAAPVPEGADLRASFDARYASIYGHHGELHEEVQLVRLRLSAYGVIDKPTLSRIAPNGTPAPLDERQVYFDGAWHTCPVYDREALGFGARFAGPGIVDEFGATTVLPPGWEALVDELGNLLLGPG
ncbi:MAG: hydantoinase/oxoprolinase family protein [Chloroflexi bacterium]|nr:hydantoinase/oxoprolinase family protein [Chloroflexota bacterium]